MNDSFYRDFEDRFRGSRELILWRLSAYRPFIGSLAGADGAARAVDLGCGRGEWLELLGENGFDAFGVDLDDGMLSACRERGLTARNADALTTLQSLGDESMLLVSAFHVVEHLPFDAVRVLVREALRVLAPGGLLILETPNPDNLAVGACSFYLDPSHQRPLPSALLNFAAEHAGFCRSKVLFLQEAAELRGDAAVELHSVISGASPDYAVVAQKAAAPEVLAALDAAFAADYGLSMATLAQRYDRQASARAARIEDRLAQAEDRAMRVDGSISLMTDRLAGLEGRLDDVLTSRSWRVTAPLRWATEFVRRLRRRLTIIFGGVR